MKNIKNKQYEDFLWVDKLHIKDLSLGESFQNNISGNNKFVVENNIEKNIFSEKITNRNKDFSFSEQNSNFSIKNDKKLD